MRIRKNAKQSPLSEPVPESLRTQVCQLNQSPWDVTPFSPPTSPSYDHPPYPSLLQPNYQFDGEDSLTGNGSFGDSIGAVESSSVASMIDEADEERAAAHIHDNDKYYCATRSDNYHVLDEKEEEDSKMEDPFKDGPSQPILESCGIHNLSSTKKAQKQASSVVSSRRGRPRTVVKTKGSTSAANPYDFYYYSGFGPSWRKRRGDRAGDDHHQVQQQKDNSDHDQEFKECDNDNSIITTQNNTVPFGGSHHRNSNRNNEHEFSYLLDDDEDEDHEEVEESGRKRMRKPVKARSLKSLM